MPDAQDPTAQIISNVVLFGGIILIFYFLMIRPQHKRMKEHKAMVGGLKQGDKVITSSGMHGVVLNVQEATVKVTVADNMHIVFDKSAISSIVPKEED